MTTVNEAYASARISTNIPDKF